jgi:hypothetical protein
VPQVNTLEILQRRTTSKKPSQRRSVRTVFSGCPCTALMRKFSVTKVLRLKQMASEAQVSLC